ncbi:MAG: 23S rRNA (guanosine(2251)-2'-O)-methyltransferase RlmB [Bacteroidota bacterium]
MSKSKQQHLVYGMHPVLEAISAGKSVEKIWVKQSMSADRLYNIREAAKEKDIPVQFVPEVRLQRFVPNGNHQGVVAMLSSVSYQELEQIILQVQEKGEKPLFVMLDGVKDVRNFGAIARTAECMGAHAIIVPSQGSAAANADAVKVSAGALSYLPVCREGNLVDSLLLLQSYGIETYGCTEKASETLYTSDFREACCLIFGSEEKGMSKQILKRANHLIGIPLQGEISSLNVSVAVGMVLSEALRQRLA